MSCVALRELELFSFEEISIELFSFDEISLEYLDFEED